MRILGLAAVGLIILLIGTPLSAGHRSGILGQQAPRWDIEDWANLAEDEETLEVDAFKGKVLYLYCFQAWCPGCHKYGFPTLQELVERYEDDTEVAFVAVQTVFEGFGQNSIENGRKMSERYHLDIPFGHSGLKKERSKIMERYRTGGTPWTIVIDRDGKVRYNDFHINAEKATKLIEELKQEKPSS